jgi:hypothetical protein
MIPISFAVRRRNGFDDAWPAGGKPGQLLYSMFLATRSNKVICDVFCTIALYILFLWFGADVTYS